MDNKAAQWIGYTVCVDEVWALMIQMKENNFSPSQEEERTKSHILVPTLVPITIPKWLKGI